MTRLDPLHAMALTGMSLRASALGVCVYVCPGVLCWSCFLVWCGRCAMPAGQGLTLRRGTRAPRQDNTPFLLPSRCHAHTHTHTHTHTHASSFYSRGPRRAHASTAPKCQFVKSACAPPCTPPFHKEPSTALEPLFHICLQPSLPARVASTMNDL